MIHEEADVYNTLGLIKRQQAEHDSALYYFSKAQEIAWKQGSTTWRHILGGNIGIVYYLRGEYDKAMPFLMNDIATSLERNDYSNAINSTVKLADIYYRQKKYDSARYYADMGRWIVDSVHPPHKYLVPVFRHQEQAQAFGIYRLRHRPHTALTAAWYATMKGRVELMKSTFSRGS